MPTEKVVKPRTAFKHLLNYLHTKVIDFEQLEEDGMMPTYFKAMEFVGSVAGNTAYSPFYKKDAEVLAILAHNTISGHELGEMTNRSIRAIAPSLTKLVNLGLVYSFTESRTTYYGITPYGTKYLEELILDENSVYYS